MRPSVAELFTVCMCEKELKRQQEEEAVTCWEEEKEEGEGGETAHPSSTSR